MIEEAYGLTVTTTMDTVEAERAIRAALVEQGFGVLTEIDVAATFADKLGIEYPPYKILGACIPHLAHAALAADRRIGLLLPCNIIIAETDDGRTIVSILDPAIMNRVVDAPEIAEIAVEARRRIERALQTVS